ncbi:MAG TPA: FAD-dependent oxidoreductase [Acidothermaceae bacterium]|nr:FAD-dependent oxidoreductase [Acidothermaceae bacterium]
MKVVVVGGVAGGMSFAARARRLAEDAQIVVLERDAYVSYANCGLPYYLGSEITERSALLLHTPESLTASLARDVRAGHEVTSVDTVGHVVSVRELSSGRIYDEHYDTLVLSTGATPIVPPIPGTGLSQVRVLRSVPDVDALQALLAAGAKRAVVVGAGFIGVEVAEALRHRGLDVAIVELAPQVLPVLDPEMAHNVESALLGAGVRLHLATSATAIRQGGGRGVEVELANGTVLVSDLVLMAIGVRPETTLAVAAGLAVNSRGSVIVDEHLHTSAPDVFAVGDAIEVVDAVTGSRASVPLAGLANRQGRAVADELFGHGTVLPATFGTAIVRVFGTVAATTGRSEKALRSAGIVCHAVHLHPAQHAGYFPGAHPIDLKIVFGGDGRLLGAQATGSEGVDKRIDILATALRAGMSVDDLAELELAYAPPFGAAKDPVNMAGFIAQNVLSGTLTLWRAADLDEPSFGTSFLLDVRSADEFAAGHLSGAVHIPHMQLRARLAEVPADVAVRVYCASGFRSYLALRVLRQRGWKDVASLSGGLVTLLAERPALALSLTAGEQPGELPRAS